MQNQTKYNDIAKQLNGDIFQSKYNKRLPNNVELAKIYKTTPITIRKSLKLLEESGIVSIHRTRGGTVIPDEVLSRREISSVAFIASEAQNQITNVYFQKVFSSIQTYLNGNGSYRVQIENLPVDETNRRKAVSRIREMYVRGYYCGAIVTTDFTTEEVKELLGDNIPLAVLGRAAGLNVPSVKHNDDILAKMIIDEVKRIRVKRVAVISKPARDKKYTGGKTSLEQVIEALSGDHLLNKENIRFIKDDGEFEDAASATAELLKNNSGIDLFITYGSNISRGCYMELNMNKTPGRKCPKLLPVTDEDVIGPFPNLLIPIREIGETAADLLIQSINRELADGDFIRRLDPYWRNHPKFVPTASKNMLIREY